MRLFEQTQIRNMTMKNHIIRAATGDEYAEKGHYSEKDFETYENLAKGGVGTIITGFSIVSDYGMDDEEHMFRISDDSYIPEYKNLTDMVHHYDANIVMQLVHFGSYTTVAGQQSFAPSSIQNLETKNVPEEMTIEDILRVEEDFVKAAVRAKSAGFDGVEIHAGHGFLISEFLTPYYNQRIDAYGGSDENRARFLREILQKVRAAVGEDYPVFIKINCEDGFDGGITYEGFEKAALIAEEAGADLIAPSGHWYTIKNKAPYYLEATKKIAARLQIPVCLVGGVREVADMEKVLNDGIAYVAMSRPFICEPDFPNKLKNGDVTKVKCVSCNFCVNNPGLTCIFNRKK